MYLTELAEDTYEMGWSVWSLWWRYRETSVIRNLGTTPLSTIPDSSFVASDDKEQMLEMLLFI